MAVTLLPAEAEATDYVDMFAGPGGWDVAAAALGMDGVGIEWDATACNTRRAAGFRTIEGDVRHWAPGWFYQYLQIASPPCQTFSAAGNGAGRRALDLVLAELAKVAETPGAEYRPDPEQFDDPRTALVLEPLWWALRALADGRPYTAIAWEQVPAVLPVWEAAAEVLRERGYHVAVGILNAEQYGVPQTRRRAVLIANRLIEVSLPTPTHSRYYSRSPEKLDPGLPKWVSMAEALGWGMDARPSMTLTCGGTDTGGAEPFGNGARKGMEREAEAGRWQVRNSGPGAARKPRPAEDAPSYTIRAHGSGSHPSGTEWTVMGDVPGIGAPTGWPWEDKPATTVAGTRLTAREHHNHGEQGKTSRRVSVEEAAALQTFPDGYPWQGTKTKQYEQVGNAVPPLLAWHVLRAALGFDKEGTRNGTTADADA